MRHSGQGIAILLLVTFADTACAQTVQPAEAPAAASPSAGPDSNFMFAPAEGRQLKIDRRTGTVSLCAESEGRWTCQLVADDRQAYEERIAELETENAALEARLRQLETRIETLETAGKNKSTADDNRKVDEFMALSDRLFRHFFDLVREFKQDLDKPI